MPKRKPIHGIESHRSGQPSLLSVYPAAAQTLNEFLPGQAKILWADNRVDLDAMDAIRRKRWLLRQNYRYPQLAAERRGEEWR